MRRLSLVPKACFAVVLCTAMMGSTVLLANSESFSTTIPASDGFTAPTTASFSLPQFNPTLGTLTGIEVDFSLNYQGEVDIENFSGAAQTVSASSSEPIDMDTPSNPSLQLVLAAYSITNTAIGAPSGKYPFLGPAQNGTFPFTPAPAAFPSYEGNGNSSYTLSYANGTFGGTAAPGGLVFFGGDANSSGSAKVTYTFTAVPEPSSLLLLAVGAIGLAAIGLRKRAHA